MHASETQPFSLSLPFSPFLSYRAETPLCVRYRAAGIITAQVLGEAAAATAYAASEGLSGFDWE
jgi:hypothetical protein